MFTKILVCLALLFCVGCGGGSPSDIAQFEIGLVGQYELVELHGNGFDLVHAPGQARLGDMLLQDDNSFEQNFTNEAYDHIGYMNDIGTWHATLSTITFNGDRMGYDTSKANHLGTDIGDTLTIHDPFNDMVFVWYKVTTAPRN
jgi:hypothetical protein